MINMREKLLNLKSNEHKSFKKHFLKSVHMAFTLSSINSEIIFSKEEELNNKFKEINYSKIKEIKRVSFQVDSEKGATIKQEGQSVGIVLKNNDFDQQIELSENKLVYSDFNYIGFKEFLEKLKIISPIIENTFQCEIERVGFRKINSILVDPVESYIEACELFNPALFGVVRSGLPVISSITNYEDVLLLEKDDYKCFIKTRFMKKGEPSEYEINLDFDLINEKIKTFEDLFDGTLKKMNQTHFDLFLWSITAELKDLMSKE